MQCNCLHESSLTYDLTNFQDNHYFYDWGMVEQIFIPEKNLSTSLTWKRLDDWYNYWKMLNIRSKICTNISNYLILYTRFPPVFWHTPPARKWVQQSTGLLILIWAVYVLLYYIPTGTLNFNSKKFISVQDISTFIHQHYTTS